MIKSRKSNSKSKHSDQIEVAKIFHKQFCRKKEDRAPAEVVNVLRRKENGLVDWLGVVLCVYVGTLVCDLEPFSFLVNRN